MLACVSLLIFTLACTPMFVRVRACVLTCTHASVLGPVCAFTHAPGYSLFLTSNFLFLTSYFYECAYMVVRVYQCEYAWARTIMHICLYVFGIGFAFANTHVGACELARACMHACVLRLIRISNFKRKTPVGPRWAKQQTRIRPQPTKMNSFKSGPS